MSDNHLQLDMQKRIRNRGPSHRRIPLWTIFGIASSAVIIVIFHVNLSLEPNKAIDATTSNNNFLNNSHHDLGNATATVRGKEPHLYNFSQSKNNYHQRGNVHKSGLVKRPSLAIKLNSDTTEKNNENTLHSSKMTSPLLATHPESSFNNNSNTLKKHNSNETLPSVLPLINRSQKVELPDPTRILTFVHIGKSGGSTISSLLRNGCMESIQGKPCEPNRWEKFPGPAGRSETTASRRISFYLHTPHAEQGKLPDYYSRVTSIVAVARDPLERFFSAFLTRHPKNMDETRSRNKRARMIAELRGEPEPLWAKKVWPNGKPDANEEQRVAFRACYPNVEEFAHCVEIPRGERVYNGTIQWWWRDAWKYKNISLDCGELCRDVVLGRSEFVHHARWGYQAFLNPLPQDREVFVIRTNYLWNDWIHVNNLLGSTYDVPVPSKKDAERVINARGRLPVRNNVSEKGKRILCRCLKEEIRMYINLLNRAVNLSDEDVRVTLEDLQRNCPEVVETLMLENEAR
mmetsp:Transcript_3312/g.6333  ORF Transcript_3312/g.6333 Transcript_3312/m.6333 type:complete len:517 (+) Transcript_3312:198-1748(+)